MGTHRFHGAEKRKAGGIIRSRKAEGPIVGLKVCLPTLREGWGDRACFMSLRKSRYLQY